MKPATTALAPVPDPDWITKEEAATILAIMRNGRRSPISVRRVQEFAQRGALVSGLQRDPKSHQMMTMLSREDCLRFRDERDNPRVLPVVPRASTPLALPAPPQLPAPAVPVLPACEWLTLAQGEIHCGLPMTFLLALIQSGTLAALDVGIREGGRFRVKRSDLDAIQGVRVVAG